MAFIQARQGSSRLPNKIYKELNGAPVLYHVINKAKEAANVSDVIVLSPQILPDVPEGIGTFVWPKNERDVLGRYYAALQEHPCDYIVRLTADCPLLDPNIIDLVIAESIGRDYGSNVLVSTFPDGMDVEVISADFLKYLHEVTDDIEDREHVTTAVRTRPMVQRDNLLLSVESIKDYSYLKLSVDTEDDLYRISEFECQK